MRIVLLAIDTSDQTTGVAILEDGEIVATGTLGLVKTRDTALSDLTQSVLSESGFGFKDLSVIALSAGPGSFTGLRVGCAFAKGLCLALDIPLVAVDSLEALANSVTANDRLLLPLIHAKGAEVYYAIFSRIAGNLQRLSNDNLIDYRLLPSRLDKSAYAFGSGYLQHKSTFASIDQNLIGGIEIEDDSLVVKSVAKMGWKNFSGNQIVDIRKFEPKYLQEFTINV
jgi:tRNA threonylcarbamoyladenosine biosynthesis protein TsaB